MIINDMNSSGEVKDVELQEENGEMYEHFRIEVDRGQGLLRIDKFLYSKLEGVSRNRVQNAAKAGCVLVNGKCEKQNYRVKPADIISIVMAQPPREVEIIAEDIPIDIVYEDDDIIVVNKPAGLVVHPGFNNYTGTLLNALVYHITKTKGGDPKDNIPYLVHRIDKDTSGILLIAKNELAQTKLAKQFFYHTIDRKYNALVWGDFEEDEGTITGNIGRSFKDRKVMDVFPPDGDLGKHAVTHYRVLERFGYVTLVECKLETGRTHQIRAHFKHIGHPLFGDETYGGTEILRGTTFAKYKQFVMNNFEIVNRQALHARSLAFIHPTTNQLVSFESDLPEDISKVLERWRTYVN